MSITIRQCQADPLILDAPEELPERALLCAILERAIRDASKQDSTTPDQWTQDAIGWLRSNSSDIKFLIFRESN